MDTVFEKEKQIIVFDENITGDVVFSLKQQVEIKIQSLPDNIKEIFLDFSHVKSIDVQGFNFLIELYIICTRKQIGLKIIHCPNAIQKQLGVFKLDCLFCITEK